MSKNNKERKKKEKESNKENKVKIKNNNNGLSKKKNKVFDKNIAVLSGGAAPALKPNKYVIGVSYDSFGMAAYVTVEQYGMKTDLQISNSTTQQPKVPSGYLALYLYTALSWYIKEHGNLNGPNFYLIPDMSNLCVPVCFAKWLAQFGAYEEDGSCGISTMTYTQYLASYDFPSAAVGALPFVAAGLISAQQVMSTVYASTSGEYRVQVPPAPITNDAFMLLIAQISESLSLSQFETIELGKIPGKAPDGSAYSDIFAGITDPSSYIWCRFRNYNPEVAFLYHPVFSGNSELTMFRSPVQFSAVGNTWSQFGFSYLYVNMSTFMFCWLYHSYKHGPIIGTSKYCKVFLKFLAPLRTEVNFSNTLQYFANWYKQVRFNANVGTPTTSPDPNGTFFSQFMSLGMNVILHRLNTTAAFYTYSQYLSPQFYVTSSFWRTVMVPAPVAQAISDIGPVVIDGRLIVPCITPAASIAQENITDVFQILITGYSGASPAINCLFNSDSWLTVAPPPLTLSGILIDATFQATTNQLNTLNLLAVDLYGNVLQFMNSNFAGSPMSGSLIHQHYPPCGSLVKHCSIVEVALGNTASSVFLPTAYSPTIMSNNYIPVAIQCDVQMSSVELSAILACPFNTNYNLGNVTNIPEHKYSLILAMSGNINQMQLGITAETFIVGGSFEKAVAMRQSKFNDSYLSEGMPIEMRRKPTDDCFWASLLAGAWQAISPFVIGGVASAAAAGTKSVVHWVGSKLNSEGNDTPTPISKDKFDDVKRSVLPKKRVPMPAIRNAILQLQQDRRAKGYRENFERGLNTNPTGYVPIPPPMPRRAVNRVNSTYVRRPPSSYRGRGRGRRY